MKVAVIGVGTMGRHHARVYSELPEADLVAISDSDSIRADSTAEKFGIRAYTDHREMLDKEKPDAVSVVVPTALHEKVGMDALDAGVNVLIEKPIAATVEEGARLIDKARAMNKQLMVGHVVRFDPALQALKQKLDAGELGRIYQIFCRRAGPFPARIQDVGVVIDLAPHDVDIMRFLAGTNPTRVYSEIEQRIHTDHEDLLWATLRFPDGIIGGLEINWLTPTKIREVCVLGERGMFRADALTQDLYFYENSLVNTVQWATLQTIKGVSEGSMTRYAIPRFEPLKAELQSFLKALQDGNPVPITGEDGLAALKISLALVESGHTHQVVDLQ
ncbi:MAG: scyllo-inositol 2-dehydrogenase (NAD(+)) [Anaerolineales bacterium]|nr:Gfo/Idh/MocA family oxidoreductase [Anaerolineae bacterium]MBL8105026.1 Gfo/Idh/MocA family oxidoreductase [Anaerolineales bacterium]MBV6402492.1 scyllo-inositol 2-dehydrogenase (NAD(+)) [Anaerolineales bacterium]MCC7187986.1 Gfo/Idh/MocA family oxidoreductase [Anaerolineales bacterium]HQU36892.1 Gfo/Idh/MocA family oxidoreductase [Anaerolineales bacterium]